MQATILHFIKYLMDKLLYNRYRYFSSIDSMLRQDVPLPLLPRPPGVSPAAARGRVGGGVLGLRTQAGGARGVRAMRNRLRKVLLLRVQAVRRRGQGAVPLRRMWHLQDRGQEQLLPLPHMQHVSAISPQRKTQGKLGTFICFRGSVQDRLYFPTSRLGKKMFKYSNCHKLVS